MEPKEFPQVNRRLAAPAGMTPEQVGTLPIFSDGQYCVSLWQMTWQERLSALWHGHVWLYVMTGNTQPPVALEVTHDLFATKGDAVARVKHFMVNLSIINRNKDLAEKIKFYGVKSKNTALDFITYLVNTIHAVFVELWNVVKDGFEYARNVISENLALFIYFGMIVFIFGMAMAKVVRVEK